MSDWTEYALQHLAERGNQSTDDWSDQKLQDQIDDAIFSVVNAYIDEHSRPGCDCDDCTDETCPNKTV